MSTPISTLPLKTQQSNTGDVNDINDPIVQDVLNEFQEELMISKQPKTPQISQQQQMLMQQQQQQQHQQMLMQQQQQQMLHQHPPMPSHPPNGNNGSNGSNTINKYDSISSYLDTEVAKKSLILVIIAVIIYHSGIINTLYEKMPEYLQDNLNTFDIYIKSISLFSIIYVLSFFEYI
jgi:preprotein translocase subunit SecF